MSHDLLRRLDAPTRRTNATSGAALGAIASAFLLGTVCGCAALSYDAPADDATQVAPSAGSAEPDGATDEGMGAATPAAPTLLDVSPDVPADAAAETGEAEIRPLYDAFDAPAEEPPRSWYALTRAAREKRQIGKFDEMATLLEQARHLVADRPAKSIQRRTVHGMQARLALDLLALGRTDEANALADRLFEEAESEPEVGGAATIELASRFSNHRGAVAGEDGLDSSALPLMRIALDAAETDTPNRQRLGLAFEVAREAEYQGDLALARKAIDRAIADSRIIESANREQLANLQLHRARIALAQGDLDEAEQSAGATNRLLDELGATDHARAIGEATMAHVVAERGDEDRARAIARSAQSRLGGDPPPPDALLRRVLGELARMEEALGDLDAAREHYRAALELPGTASAMDQQLVETLNRERAALDTPDDAPRVELDPIEDGAVAP